MKNKIAFTGISGSGKDYFVKHLENKYGYKRVSFSDQLKKIATCIYPWMKEDYEPYEKEQPLNLRIDEDTIITKTPREIWVSLNDLRKNDNKLFLRHAKKEVDEILKNDGKVVISDIRPQIEFDYCRKNDFTIIYIKPAKNIYNLNDFDKQIFKYEKEADYLYVNYFDGLEDFDKFIQFIIEGDK